LPPPRARAARIVQFPLRQSATFQCLSADIDVAGGGSCDAIGTPSAVGQNTGFEFPESVVASRDGESVYVSAPQDAGVARFKRDRTTGALTHKGCITGEAGIGPDGSDACAPTPTRDAGGVDSGLQLPQLMALSPDDASLYLSAANDDAVAHFRRQR
jgi:hypothetical protein